MKILAPKNEKGDRKWIKTIDYILEVEEKTFQLSNKDPIIPELPQTVSDLIVFRKPTKEPKFEKINDLEANFDAGIKKTKNCSITSKTTTKQLQITKTIPIIT
jgi:hypothetical protein